MGRVHREWSAAAWHREESGDVGVQVFDAAYQVCYRVAVGWKEGVPYLETLQVVPLDGAAVDQAMLRRVPIATLTDYAVAYLALRTELWESRGKARPPGNPLVLGGLAGPGAIRPGTDKRDVPPTNEELAQMLRQLQGTPGIVPRNEIAKRYGRSPSTVSDWIGKAYREVPELMPPKRGGRPPRKPTPKRDLEPETPSGETFAGLPLETSDAKEATATREIGKENE